MERFVVKQHGNGSWLVRDNESKEWRMPEMAVSMYLRREAAQDIARLLNQEWRAFLNNPS